MPTTYHDRFTAFLDRYGKRRSMPRAKKGEATDKSGWRQIELNLTGEAEKVVKAEHRQQSLA